MMNKNHFTFSGIINKYKSCETLLLSSAALANLTFMEPRTVWPLLEYQTAKALLSVSFIFKYLYCLFLLGTRNKR